MVILMLNNVKANKVLLNTLPMLTLNMGASQQKVRKIRRLQAYCDTPILRVSIGSILNLTLIRRKKSLLFIMIPMGSYCTIA